MLDREALIRTGIATLGALIFFGVIVVASQTSAGDAGSRLVVGGIAGFILYLTVAGYWLSAR